MENAPEKDLKLVSKVIETGDIITPRRFGVTAQMLQGPGRALWEFIESFWEKYQSLPSVETCNAQLSPAGLKLLPSPEPLDFLIQEICDRDLFEDLKEFQVNYDRWMFERPPTEVLRDASSVLLGMQRKALRNFSVDKARDILPEVQKNIEEASKGLLGIKTPWVAMDDATGGWLAGDLTFFVARPAGGKTWCVILVCEAARMSGKRVLFVSCEMTKADVVMRHLSIWGHIPYRSLRRGKMNDIERMRYRSMEKEYDAQNLIQVVDASAGLNTSQIESAISLSSPDLVVIDAAYRLRSAAKASNRFENMSYVTTELKSIASRCQVPIVASTQLNRDFTKKKGAPGTEDLAMSDALGWEATNVFVLIQNPEMKASKRMGFYPVKIREGENAGRLIMSKWNFDMMEFGQVSEFEVAPATSDDELESF